MPETRFEMRPYGVRYDCDECGTEMVPDPHGPRWVTTGKDDAARYPYRCPGCNHRAELSDRYPTVRWEKVAILPDPDPTIEASRESLGMPPKS